jgi:virulence factor Mce-like protein
VSRIVVLAALALAFAVGVMTLGGNGHQRRLRLVLDNAHGLEDGSPVMVGGVRRGSVDLSIGHDDRIDAELRLDRSAPVIDRGVRVAIVATNLLGQKRVELYPAARPRGNAPSGFVVPSGQVTTPTDLDELLGVLDADTRTRASILLNELGTAVLGRRTDIRQLLAELPGGMSQATRVLAQIEADNAQLRTLVTRAHGFVGEAARKRKDLAGLIDAAGRAAAPLAARRHDLDASLRQAPRTLVAARSLLAGLTQTAAPLGRVARELSATAPPLQQALAQVEPFTAAAGPTLDAATAAAPKLAQLGLRATPDLRRVQPAVAALSRLSTSLLPISRTLDHSSDNALAILENWARAIQFRDGLGHVFRGEASFSPDVLRSAVERLIAPATRPARRKATDKHPAAVAPATSPKTAPQTDASAPKQPPLPKPIAPILKGLLGGLVPTGTPDDSPVNKLLGFLLGP